MTATVAQPAEHRICTPEVAGSIPAGGSIPLERWLASHEPTERALNSSHRAPFSADRWGNIRHRKPLTHAELWAKLIAESGMVDGC